MERDERLDEDDAEQQREAMAWSFSFINRSWSGVAAVNGPRAPPFHGSSARQTSVRLDNARSSYPGSVRRRMIRVPNRYIVLAASSWMPGGQQVFTGWEEIPGFR